MDVCEVLIVGGGPAGSTCARHLRRAGLDVMVLDRRTFPRDKTCAGWVTPPVVELLELDPDEYRATRTFQPITAFCTGLIGGPEIDTTYAEPVSFGIRRFEFDHYLLKRCGARLRLGEPLRSLERTPDGWRINGDLQARVVVGAGGHFCPVARQLGNGRDTEAAVVAAQEVEFAAPATELAQGTVRGERPELFFCPDLAGYGWCFRKGDYLNIGLGRTDPHQLGQHVAGFCDFLRERGKVRCAIPAKFHGHAYRLYERTSPPLALDGALLVGDAAGLAYPQSGEGIRPAVESALIAADVLKQAAGCYDAGRLAPYADRVAARFGPPRPASWSERLPAAWLHFLASRLMASRWFTRRVVLDQWFLHAQEPALNRTFRVRVLTEPGSPGCSQPG